MIDPVTLHFPALPAALEGLRVLHVSDLHVRRSLRRYEALIAAVGTVSCDLLAMTGDVMDKSGEEKVAREVAARLVEAARPRIGAFGVWGNHDSPALRDRLADLPVRWLVNEAWGEAWGEAWREDSLPLTILGVDCGEEEHAAPRGDLLAAALDYADPGLPGRYIAPGLPGGGGEEHGRGMASSGEGKGVRGVTPGKPGAIHDDSRFRLLLAHQPTWLPAAGSFGVDLMLCGHTHGGQVRVPLVGPLYNATPGWPLRLSSGLRRMDRTVGLISRGLGESWMDGLRLFCPRHAPLITLQTGAKADF